MNNSITLPMDLDRPQSISKLKLGFILALVVSCFVLIAEAQAGSGGAAFTSIWTEISGWADGVPGKIITLLAFFAALFNVMKQNYYMAVGAFISGMLLSQSVTIINVFLTGTV